MIGEMIDGRYRVDSKLGAGGMATIFLAVDVKVDRTVVIKVPDPRLLVDSSFRERFEREKRSLIQLSHPHIVKVIDAGEFNETPFVVLEYLAGGSLADRIDAAGGKLTAGDVVDWLPDVAKTLDFIHGLDVVHRDVKPANILFDEHGNVFLADFGIAKALISSETAMTTTGMMPGTPDYMAPESGITPDIDGRADQYALASVLYRAFTKTLPFVGQTPIAVLLKKQSGTPPSLVKLAPEIPVGAAQAVMRGLAREPDDRFASCDAFAKAFIDGLLADASEGERRAAPTDATLTGEAISTPVPDSSTPPPPPPPPPTGAPTAVTSEPRAPTPTPTPTPGPAPVSHHPTTGVPAPTGRSLPIGVVAGLVIAATLVTVLVVKLVGGGDAEESTRPDERGRSARGGGGGDPKKDDDVDPKKEDVDPKKDDIDPKKDDVDPKKDDIDPKKDDVDPKIEDVDPKKDDVDPKKDDVDPKQDDVFTRLHPGNAHPYDPTVRRRVAAMVDGKRWQRPGWNDRGMIEIVHGATGLTFILVPGGRFVMGGDEKTDPGSEDDERPTHAVTVPAFLLAKTEVPQRAWDEILGFDDRAFTGADLPIDGVSWDEAVKWCKRAGSGLRLPSEAEWEYACRAGTTEYLPFPWKDYDRSVWYENNSGGRTHPVGTKAPNRWGFHDMLGNVWEVCQDRYAENYAATPRDGSANEKGGTLRVGRGGSFEDDDTYCRSAAREAGEPNVQIEAVGLRPAVSIP